MSNTRMFQFVASWMVSKLSNAEPNDGAALAPTKIIQTNAAGNIAGSLTTIAQEGGFGAIDKADRSMLYLAPSMTFYSNRYGSHVQGGADIYPFIRNVTSSDAAGRILLPASGHDRQPTCCSSGARCATSPGPVRRSTTKYERHAAFYFQDRWKPTSSISIKAGLRIETNSIYTKDRETVLGPRLPSNFPTNTADREFHQTVGMPNACVGSGQYGVFRATANRSYEWLDLGGGDGTSHAPHVLTTDVFRNPRTLAPALNETLPGQFASGSRMATKDGSIHNGRTYVNEFSAG